MGRGSGCWRIFRCTTSQVMRVCPPTTSGTTCARWRRSWRQVTREFIAILSQGTSGDLWRADYKLRHRRAGVKSSIMRAGLQRCRRRPGGISYQPTCQLAMSEQRLMIGRRVPDADGWHGREGSSRRWAVGDRRISKEVYARASDLHPRASRGGGGVAGGRIGEFGITAMPNEVYGLSGLKLKYRSPLEMTMNIELANGAAGYIPPPEQYPLGGYNTWPARTAGLVAEAETSIVETNLRLLEDLSGRPRQNLSRACNCLCGRGAAFKAESILAARGSRWWRT